MSPSYLKLLESLRLHCQLPNFPDPLPSTQLDLEFEEGLIITIDWNKENDFVEIFSELGAYDKKQELEILKKIVKANFLWSATAGATLSARPEVQTVYLAYQAPVSTFKGEEFIELVEKLILIAQEWRQLLSLPA